MSALELGMWRRCARAMRSLLAGPAMGAATRPVAQTFADLAFAEMNLLADDDAHGAPSIYIFCSVGELAAALTTPLPNGVSANAMTTPAPAARVPTSKRTTERPLAIQLAVTAARNVRKGQKSRSFVAQSTRTKTSKPAAKTAVKKRAPKRRHVWLSNQSRVIRPIAGNVVSLARQARVTTKPTVQKTPGRLLRLAA
jgi:hypothetical protein